jgi:hypothetical protein
MFSVGCELDLYISFRRNSVLKGLNDLCSLMYHYSTMSLL